MDRLEFSELSVVDPCRTAIITKKTYERRRRGLYSTKELHSMLRTKQVWRLGSTLKGEDNEKMSINLQDNWM